MNTTPSTPVPPPIPAECKYPAIFTLALAGLLTWAADFLFWKLDPGISVAIYVCVVAGVIIALNSRASRSRLLLPAAVLLILSSWATAFEISLTNICVLGSLLAVIFGEALYPALAGRWARWTESLVAWAMAPGRWWRLGREFKRTHVADRVFSEDSWEKSMRVMKIAMPALCLALVFGIMFNLGNAVFSELAARVTDTIERWIAEIDISPMHIGFCALFATFALACVIPRAAGKKPRFWTRAPGRITHKDDFVAVWQSRIALLMVNALFFMVNTIDVFYLWNHKHVPHGVTLSDYVHKGVFSLIFAVLLSAVVLAMIFQQEERITRSRFLKGFALLWIMQNLLLIAGVFLRLKLYVDVYELTELRIYVGCFLLLVTEGFLFLAWHVAFNGRIESLMFRCVLATFVLFFAVQFVNVAGIVGRYNVGRWKRDPQHTLDVAYLDSLGPGAWRYLAEVAAFTDRPEASNLARTCLRQAAIRETVRMEHFDWRSLQARRDLQATWLVEQSNQYPPPPGQDPLPRSGYANLNR